VRKNSGPGRTAMLHGLMKCRGGRRRVSASRSLDGVYNDLADGGKAFRARNLASRRANMASTSKTAHPPKQIGPRTNAAFFAGRAGRVETSKKIIAAFDLPGNRDKGCRPARRQHDSSGCTTTPWGAPDGFGDRASYPRGAAQGTKPSASNGNLNRACALSQAQPGRTHAEIPRNQRHRTQITTVQLPPKNQAEVLQVMARGARRFMATGRLRLGEGLHKSEGRQPSLELRANGGPREA